MYQTVKSSPNPCARFQSTFLGVWFNSLKEFPVNLSLLPLFVKTMDEWWVMAAQKIVSLALKKSTFVKSMGQLTISICTMGLGSTQHAIMNLWSVIIGHKLQHLYSFHVSLIIKWWVTKLYPGRSYCHSIWCWFLLSIYLDSCLSIFQYGSFWTTRWSWG